MNRNELSIINIDPEILGGTPFLEEHVHSSLPLKKATFP